MSVPPDCPLCGSPYASPLVTGCRDYEYGVPWRADYLRCYCCGMARLSPLPDLKELAAFYPPDYANYAPPTSRLSRLLMDLYDWGVRTQATTLAPHGGRLLDVGCGGGQYLDKLAGLGLELHGSEFSEDAATPARQKGHIVHAGALEELALPEGHFKVIRMNHVIEHVLNPVTTLKSAARLLAPNGTVLIETPNLACPDFKILGRYWGALHFPRHLHLFTPRTMRRAADLAGLDVSRVKYTPMPTGWSLGLQNLLAGTIGVRIVKGRCALYPFFMLGFLPLAALQMLTGAGTMMQIHLTKPEP